MQKEKIFTVLKYVGAFLLCTILLTFVIWLLEVFDQDKLELTKCFLFEAGRIKETFDYQSYLQGYCQYSQICACVVTSEWILFFYIWALPIFVFYEVLRRKIVPPQYRYLCVFGEIAIWSILWYFNQDNIPYKWFAIGHTYRFMAPMTIILLVLHSLPAKVFRIVSMIIGIIYGLYYGTVALMMIPNFFS